MIQKTLLQTMRVLILNGNRMATRARVESIISKLGLFLNTLCKLMANSNSKLKNMDTLLKDAKYRGTTASRKDLFNGGRISSLSEEVKNGENDLNSNQSSDMEDDEDSLLDNSDAVAEDSLIDASDSEEMLSPSENIGDDDDDAQDEQARQEKVRRLLAQESRYCVSLIKPLILAGQWQNS
jgi:hypothetical protein